MQDMSLFQSNKKYIGYIVDLIAKLHGRSGSDVDNNYVLLKINIQYFYIAFSVGFANSSDFYKHLL